MEHADRTNYEQEHPHHPPENEFYERATRRLDQALQEIARTEERMARNISRTKESR